MKLHDLYGQTFELKILGYQFPDNTDSKWDANWLNIQITVDSKEGKWNKTDPSLMADEVKTLSEWLSSVSQSKSSKILDFTEPNLKFENINKDHNTVVRIYFELELRPSWNQKGWVGDDSFFIELTLDKNELLIAAHDLQEVLKLFPYRKV